MNFDKTPFFGKTEIADFITEHALVLMGDDGRNVRPEGSAIFVAPELAITAQHVVEAFWKTFQPEEVPTDGRPTNCPFRIQALQFPGTSTEPALWQLNRGWCSPWTDIAFLELRPGNDLARSYKWTRNIAISIQPPKLGDGVFGFGYANTNATFDSPLEDQRISYGLNGRSTKGEVVAVYPEYRELGFLRFPCFGINARFDGGMSGGPLFNEAGQICGLICATSTPSTSDAQLSWGAPLWPAMVTEIQFEGPGGKSPGLYPAFHLLIAKIIHCEDDWNSLGKRIDFRKHADGQGYVALKD